MAVCIQSIPGYGLVHAESLYKEHIGEFLRTLRDIDPYCNIDDLLQSGRIRPLGHVECFPDRVREIALSTFIPSSVVFNPFDGFLYVDISRVSDSSFVPEFFAEVGITASLFGKNSKRIISLLKKLEKITLTQEEQKLFESAKARVALDHKRPIPHIFAYHLVRELFVSNAGMSDAVYDKILRESKLLLAGERSTKRLTLQHLYGIAIVNMRNFLLPWNLPQKAQYVKPTAKKSYPLTVCVKDAPFPFPNGPWFLKKTQLNALNKAPGTPFFQVCKDSPEEPLWSLSIDDTVPVIDEMQSPLESLSVRPMAKLHSRFVTDNITELNNEQRAFLNIQKLYWADLALNECNAVSFLPHFTAKPNCFFQIDEAYVSPRLDTAALKIVTGSPSVTLFALSTSWSMQANRLKTLVPYQANLCFWVKTLKPVHALKSGSLVTQREFFIFGGHSVGKIGKEEYWRLACKVEGIDVDCLLPSTSVTKNALLPGRRFTACGVFLLGEIEHDNPMELTRANIELLPRLEANREFAKLADQGDCPSLYRLYLNLDEKNTYAAKKRKQILLHLCHKHYPKALARMARNISEMSDAETAALANAGRTFACEAIADESFEALATLALPDNPLGRKTPIDLCDPMLHKLALFQGHPGALNLLGRHRDDQELARFLKFTKTQRQNNAQIAVDYFVHALVGGEDAAAYDLARLHATGATGESNFEAAHAALMLAVSRGLLVAQYWAGAYDRLGVGFFTKSREEIRHALTEGVEEGLPSSQLLLGLHYEFNEPDYPESRLIAHALYRWVETTTYDKDAEELRKAIEQTFTEQERIDVRHFDLWHTLKLKTPRLSVPIRDIAGNLPDGPVILHPAFLRSIDPCLTEKPSQRLMRQVSFFALNSEPVKLGLARTEAIAGDDLFRLTAFGAPAEETKSDENWLLVSSVRRNPEDAWNIESVYPFFKHGTKLCCVIQGAIVNRTRSCAVLTTNLISEGKTAMAVSAFDPLWPLLNSRYRTGEMLQCMGYGLVDKIKIVKSIFDDFPQDLKQSLAKKIKDAHAQSHRLVSVVSVDRENALYELNTTVHSVTPAICTIASVVYDAYEVDSFGLCPHKNDTLTLYVDRQRLARMAKPGERIDVLFELHLYMLQSVPKESHTIN